MEDIRTIAEDCLQTVQGISAAMKDIIKRCDSVSTKAPQSPVFEWEEWKEYEKMRIKKKRPMSTTTKFRAVAKLRKLSSGNEELAKRILLQSVDNCWQGLFSVME